MARIKKRDQDKEKSCKVIGGDEFDDYKYSSVNWKMPLKSGQVILQNLKSCLLLVGYFVKFQSLKTWGRR